MTEKADSLQDLHYHHHVSFFPPVFKLCNTLSVKLQTETTEPINGDMSAVTHFLVTLVAKELTKR